MNTDSILYRRNDIFHQQRPQSPFIIDSKDQFDTLKSNQEELQDKINTESEQDIKTNKKIITKKLSQTVIDQYAPSLV